MEDLLKLVSQTVSLGVGNGRQVTAHLNTFGINASSAVGLLLVFPHLCPFLTISLFLPGRGSVQRGRVGSHILPNSWKVKRGEQCLASEQPFKGGSFRVCISVLKSAALGESTSPSVCLPLQPRREFPLVPRSKTALTCLSCMFGSPSAAEKTGQGRYPQSKAAQTALPAHKSKATN